ncbi:GntR family transcriptional regulator [Streptomyces sp. NPDC014846]|uniref:GntR family transcriptional regulator n=1 Tax=Streptomyces sp. NPDC014846 TaxID=3364922 RepID=UPI0036F98F91
MHAGGPPGTAAGPRGGPTGLPQGAAPGLERPGPLRDRVQALLGLITTRALRPGRHLVENELAAHLGVSRQPVREALRRLATEGRVDLRPAQGAFVHEPTRKETDQLLTVRTLLEAVAARPAATHADGPGTGALEELCGEGEKAVADEDADHADALDAAFHPKVMELAGNAVLAELAAQVGRRARGYHPPGARRRGRRSWTEHRELITAIAERDEQRAHRVMRTHAAHARLPSHGDDAT